MKRVLLRKLAPDHSGPDELDEPFYGQHPVSPLPALRNVLLDSYPYFSVIQLAALVMFKIVGPDEPAFSPECCAGSPPPLTVIKTPEQVLRDQCTLRFGIRAR
jgi:hypothetical protein